MPDPMTPSEAKQLADAAIARIDLRGRRGAEQCSLEEIIGLAVHVIVLRGGIERLTLAATPVSTPPSKPPSTPVEEEPWDGSGPCPKCQGDDCDPEGGCRYGD